MSAQTNNTVSQLQDAFIGHPNQVVINNYYGVNTAQLLEIFEAQRLQIETLLKLLPQVHITNTANGGNATNTATATGNKCNTESISNSNNTFNANNTLTTAA